MSQNERAPQEDERPRDYKGRLLKKKTHRRYSDEESRPDLRALAVCRAGIRSVDLVIDDAYLTSDPKEVTCARCISIKEGGRRRRNGVRVE